MRFSISNAQQQGANKMAKGDPKQNCLSKKWEKAFKKSDTAKMRRKAKNQARGES